ncbi:hypothetical protein L1987_32007 [Smallanthus sonchifolius]|uniref:Uncharacterized protein n=1 Tax=Smallanthus sonchifolius TaxID=185202 RepID=A0ACB9I6I0_9ASTR|nr:hypothetical protein L1987_32007 [Smallanthus sonchifolius]
MIETIVEEGNSKQMGKDDEKFKIIMEVKENLRKISEKMQREAEMVIEQRLSRFNKSSVISSKKNEVYAVISDGSVIKCDSSQIDDGMVEKNKQTYGKKSKLKKVKDCGAGDLPRKSGRKRKHVYNHNQISSEVSEVVPKFKFVDEPKKKRKVFVRTWQYIIYRWGIDISALKKPKECTPEYQKWRSRFGRRTIGPSELVQTFFEDRYDDDLMFKLDFLVLFYTTMIRGCRNVEAIKNRKKGWTRCDVESEFIGPLTILTLLYVDGTSCRGINDERSLQPIMFWTMDKLHKRENMEIAKGGFSLGEHREQLVYEEVNDGIDDVELDEQDTAREKEYVKLPVIAQLSLLEYLQNSAHEINIKYHNAIIEAIKHRII